MNDQSEIYGSLSDSDLRTRSFSIDDPRSLPGLKTTVPDPTAKPVIEYSYDVGGQARGKGGASGGRPSLVRCVHCKKFNHYKGYVIQLEDGTRYLCGHECGAKLYGADFEQARDDFNAARDRKTALSRMDRLREGLPAFAAYLRELANGPGMKAFAGVKADLRARMPRLHGRLAIATLKLDMKLYLDREVRDFAGENAADRRYDRELETFNSASPEERRRLHLRPPKRPVKPIMKKEDYLVGSLPTPTLFTDACFCHGDFMAVAKQFLDLAGSPSGGLMGTRELDRVLADANRLLDKLEEMLGKFGEMQLFFEFSTLSAIADWATKSDHVQGQFQTRKDVLTFVNEDGFEREVRLPAEIQAVDLKPLFAFRQALGRA